MLSATDTARIDLQVARDEPWQPDEAIDWEGPPSRIRSAPFYRPEVRI